MKQQAACVMPGGMQAEELHVRHVRNPRKRMPVGHDRGVKSPRKIGGG